MGCKFLPRETRETWGTRTFGGGQTEIHMCEFSAGPPQNQRVIVSLFLLLESPEIHIKIVFWRGAELEAKPVSPSFDECFMLVL